MISIAMTTYNGEKYIKELLDSLLNQSMLMDEIVICDDCSNDNTINILKEYRDLHNNVQWKIIINKKNIGWKLNFRQSLFNCSGDYIFLCDQDDIWKPHKIENMKNILESNEKIEVVCSNYEVLYCGREEKIKVKGINRNDGSLEQVKFDHKAIHPLRPGCTFAFKKSIIEDMRKFDYDTQPHDCIIWNLSVLKNSLFYYNKTCILFRRHTESASTPNSKLDIYRRINEIDIAIDIGTFMWEVAIKKKLQKQSKVMKEVILFNKKRKEILVSKSVLRLLLFQLVHFNKYPTIRNKISDVIVLLKEKIQ